MSNKYTSILIIIFLSAISCKNVNKNKYFDEGYIENGKYINDIIGWSMELPTGWKVVPNQNDQDVVTSVVDIYQSAGIEVKNPTPATSLISLQKDILNRFNSYYEKVQEPNQKELKESVLMLRETFSLFFPPQVEIKRVYPIEKEKIEELDFLTFTFEIYLPPPLDMKAYGISYSAIIREYYIGAFISYSDDKNKEEIMNAWLNSKFQDLNTPIN